MRLVLPFATLALLAGATLWSPSAPLAEETCTGENCQTPKGQGGHDCEHERKEQTTS